MNNINMLITGQSLGEKLVRKLNRLSVAHIIFPKCTGYAVNENILEFLGVTEPKKYTICFVCDEEKQKVLLSYILKYHNKKNNGIMFKILEENMNTENQMFVGIVNAGRGEKLADIIRKECQSGATIFDARGSGANAKEFFGIRIDSTKEVVVSVMKSEFILKMKKLIHDNFENETTDVVSFNLPVSDFNKLHQ